MTLRSYRNIENAEVSFSPGVNVIFGRNAQGKTNLLEAIYIFARGRSFRGTPDRELIRSGDTFFTVKNEYTDAQREEELLLEHTDKKTKRYLNGVKLERNIEMISHFRAVLFCPDHLGIVKGSPSERREFMNIAISQLSRDYVYLLGNYTMALENRNALIKKIGVSGISGAQRERLLENIPVWNAQLARFAAKIAQRRAEYIEKLSPHAEFIMSEMSENTERLRIQYSCDVPDPHNFADSEQEYLRLLEAGLDRDLSAGSTQRGPHRDDLILKINGVPLRQWGSQGQQRTAVLSLKLAEGEICRELTGEHPVFLFDDVLSELDAERRKYLFDRVADTQYIITTCEADAGLASCKIIHAKNGVFTEIN